MGTSCGDTWPGSKPASAAFQVMSHACCLQVMCMACCCLPRTILTLVTPSAPLPSLPTCRQVVVLAERDKDELDAEVARSLQVGGACDPTSTNGIQSRPLLLPDPLGCAAGLLAAGTRGAMSTRSGAPRKQWRQSSILAVPLQGSGLPFVTRRGAPHCAKVRATEQAVPPPAP